MRALVIDDETKKQAAAVMSWARAHVYYPDLAQMVPGDDPHFVLMIAQGYRCVFTYTAPTGRNGLYRHLSVSVDGPKYPSPETIGAIAGLFGFTGTENEAEVIARIARHEFPRGWILNMDEAEHCIVLAEELKDEPVPHR